ncbi:MAG: adenylate/guanylate cyclase domain-containing protein [Bacteroidota bacterium]|nr:tetratricopeptide repeat protein [Candidatus Kapabacteria bacterium]MDW8220092.1 adenylate/guanylate cyclase domain-containing protein [Bacteroidota bacterium]
MLMLAHITLVSAILSSGIFCADCCFVHAQPPGRVTPPKTAAEAPIRVRYHASRTIDSLLNCLATVAGEERIRVLRTLGWEYRKFDLQPSFTYASQAVELARALHSSELAASLNVLGIAYRNIGNYPKALEIFFEALTAAEQAYNRRERGYALNNIGDVYRLQGNYEWALEYITQARTIFQELHYPEGIGYCCMRLGEIAEAKQQYEDALRFYTEAWNIRRSMGDTTQMYVSLIKIGTIYRAKREFARAKEYYQQALAFMQNSGAHSDVAMTLGRIAATEADAGQYHKAIDYAEQGLAIAQATKTPVDIVELAFILQRAHAALRHYRKAFEYQSLYIAMRDSIAGEESIKKSAAMQVRYEIERKEGEVKAAEQTTRIKLWALGGGLVASCVLIAILINRFRLKQRWTAEILRQQAILSAQAQEIELANASLREKTLLIEQERTISEKLLLNILPAEIAARLRSGEQHIAERYAHATVLFADIVNFTQLSETISPEELVTLLDAIFSAFDQIADDMGLEKIKTIGDCYMLVGGVPKYHPQHCRSIAHAAFAMLRALEAINDQHHLHLQLRIGIHTGEVIAGVIGTKKFAYDLWGDTVNTASRMESHGEAGKIQVSEAVYHALKEDFIFEDRGFLEIKGKGTMHTWFLTGIRQTIQ